MRKVEFDHAATIESDSRMVLKAEDARSTFCDKTETDIVEATHGSAAHQFCDHSQRFPILCGQLNGDKAIPDRPSKDQAKTAG